MRNIKQIVQVLGWVFLGLCGLFLISSLVFSCTSNNPYGSYRDGGFFSRSTPPGDSDEEDDDDDDDDDEDACYDHDTCEEVCRQIYPLSWSECNDEDQDTVSNWERVWRRLNAKTTDLKSQLDRIEESDLEEYLDVGIDGWLDEIEPGDASGEDGNNRKVGYSETDAKAALKWILDSEEVASILEDTSGGKEILRALIIKAEKGDCGTDCMLRETNYPGKTEHISIKGPSDLDACRPSGGIGLHSGSTSTSFVTLQFTGSLCLFRNLSHTNLVDGEDIFTAAADENNDPLFRLSYSVLDDICEGDLKKDSTENKIMCRKSLMCVLALNEEAASSSTRPTVKDAVDDWKAWDKVDDRSSLGKDYNECTAGTDRTDDNDAFDTDNLD